jgi:cellulose synthase/poly-beta-1,6-N-acetylglucosamine synthase-like glycosyltransferase
MRNMRCRSSGRSRDSGPCGHRLVAMEPPGHASGTGRNRSGRRIGPRRAAELSVVIPVYNEASNLEARGVQHCPPAWGPYEIILVDDGSTDASFRCSRASTPQIRTCR